MQSFLVRRTLAPLALSFALAAPAHAQERQVFTWTGRVDRGVQLTIRGGTAVNTSEPNMQTRGRFRMLSSLPSQDGVLRVTVDRGRGSVRVIQEPSSQNDYTAIVDVADGEGGAGTYQVSGYFSPSADALGNRGRGRGYGYGNQRRDSDRVNRGSQGNYNDRNAPALRWSGEVDSAVELIWRGGTVTQRVLSGAGTRNVSTSVSGNAMPAQNGNVVVTVRDGRGRVDVVQQPSAQNRYTTIIRIIDPEGGYGRYTVQAHWQ